MAVQALGLSRREILRASSCGFGYLALASMANREAAAGGGAVRTNPLAPRAPHFAPRAKRVIFLFMTGGPSQVDTFDYKPRLQQLSGQPVPASLAAQSRKVRGGVLYGSPWRFRQHGKSGLWISDLFPNLARCADDLCLINSMHCDSPSHVPACKQLHTGATTFSRPSLGAWSLYGLGSENDSLPGFVTIGQLGRGGEPQNHGSAFLPAAYQATPVGSGGIAHLRNTTIARGGQQKQIEALKALDAGLQRRTGADPQLEGVIESFELGFRMQRIAPEILDLGRESKQTLDAYGVGQAATDEFGRNCLLARRMAEAGVRFIEVGGAGKWDQHARLKTELPASARATDQPMAALLTDLKKRGLLKDTLLWWGGEFGRLPVNGGREGRDHDHLGYTMWLAGGGVKGGLRYGKTDEIGLAAVEDRVHLHDLHATILHLLGLDHEKLTYRHSGRDFRLTDVHGRVVKEIVG